MLSGGTAVGAATACQPSFPLSLRGCSAPDTTPWGLLWCMKSVTLLISSPHSTQPSSNHTCPLLLGKGSLKALSRPLVANLSTWWELRDLLTSMEGRTAVLKCASTAAAVEWGATAVVDALPRSIQRASLLGARQEGILLRPMQACLAALNNSTTATGCTYAACELCQLLSAVKTAFEGS